MVARLILGLFDGAYRLRVSKPTKNVLSTGLTREELAFDSTWDEIVQIVASGTATSNNTNEGSTSFKRYLLYEFPEPLPYVPMVLLLNPATKSIKDAPGDIFVYTSNRRIWIDKNNKEQTFVAFSIPMRRI
jgi:hypothetical protein